MTSSIQGHRRVALITIATILVSLGLVAYSMRLPRYPLLDSALGERAYYPPALVDILRWNKKGVPPIVPGNDILFEVQHLALVRLLDMQRPIFHNYISADKDDCTGADSSRVLLIGSGGQNVVIIGTGTLKPGFYDSSGGGYFSVEVFEFTREGRLVSRRCVTDQDWTLYDQIKTKNSYREPNGKAEWKAR